MPSVYPPASFTGLRWVFGPNFTPFNGYAGSGFLGCQVSGDGSIIEKTAGTCQFSFYPNSVSTQKFFMHFDAKGRFWVNSFFHDSAIGLYSGTFLYFGVYWFNNTYRFNNYDANITIASSANQYARVIMTIEGDGANITSNGEVRDFNTDAVLGTFSATRAAPSIILQPTALARFNILDYRVNEFIFSSPGLTEGPIYGGPPPSKSSIYPASAGSPSYMRLGKGSKSLASAQYFHELMRRKEQ